MKRIVPTILLLLISLPLLAENSWSKSISEAQKKAKRSNQLILAEMYADWCGWCRKMAAELFPAKEFIEATSDLVLLQVDTEDRGEGQELAMSLGIMRLPTVVLFTPDLEVAGMIQGYAPPGQWIDQLKATRAGYKDFLVRLKQDDGGKSSPEATYQLATELIERRRLDDAEEKLTSLSSLANAPAEVRGRSMIDLGRLAMMQNKPSDAVSRIEMAVGMKGLSKETRAEAHVILAEIYMHTQRYDDALRELEVVRDSYPDSRAAMQAQRYLRSVRARLGMH